MLSKPVAPVEKKPPNKPNVNVNVRRVSTNESQEFYRRNIEWKRQITDTNARKKSELEIERALIEIKECTFTPTLVASQDPQDDLGNNNAHPQISSRLPTRSSKRPVEDRCMQWAAHS